jgi:hypothetical protein
VRQRSVELTPQFQRSVEQRYPRGGSSDGAPSYEHFERLILPAVQFAFGRGFDELDALEELRICQTVPTPIFPPIVVFGRLRDDDTVELIDLAPDEDWFNMMNELPDDD